MSSSINCSKISVVYRASAIRLDSPLNYLRSQRKKRHIYVLLNSIAQPKFLRELQDVEVCVGEPAKLRCRVEGDPFPDIEWFVDGDKIKKGGRFDFTTDGDLVTLKISETSALDEGEYQCTATNENGTVSCSAELIVNGESSKSC